MGKIVFTLKKKIKFETIIVNKYLISCQNNKAKKKNNFVANLTTLKTRITMK